MRAMLRSLQTRLRPSKGAVALFKDVVSYYEKPQLDLQTPFEPYRFRYPLRLENFVVERPDYFMPLNDDGLPVADYGRQGWQFVPSRIAGHALGCWNLSLDHPQSGYLEKFAPCADWFAAQEGGRFRYEFDISDMRRGWISCLGQGEGISVLTRAYRAFGRSEYLDTARKAATAFETECSQGGVLSRLPDGSLFIEEYPNSRQTHVLNGAVFGLIGLDDLLEVGQIRDSRLEDIRDQIVRSIAGHLPSWTSGKWSLYNIEEAPLGVKNAATINYHAFHIAMVGYLADRFPQYGQFRAYKDIWLSGLSSKRERLTALARKLAFRAVTGW